MAPTLKRCISLLIALVLVLGMIPTAYASETKADSTEPEVTAPTDESIPEDASQAEESEPEIANPTEIIIEENQENTEEDFIAVMSLDDGIATVADTEIVGAPNAFANLTLPSGGIDIPAQGYLQHKNILPLYSVYLKNQEGYANNYYVAYCIEPGVVLGNSGGHTGTAYTIDGMTDGSGALYRLNRDQVEAIGVALMYGQRAIASKNDEESLRYEKLCRHAATQAIIWEISCGWRSPYPPYTLWDSTLYDAITPSLYCASAVWGTNFYLDGMDDAYLEIAAQMAQHYTIPSFMTSSSASASNYILIPDGTGKYSITLTDTNNILSKYTFPNTSELTFSVSGNKLTITANGPISDTLVAPTKQVPSLDNQVFFVWEYKEQQKLMSCKTDPVYSQVPAYFSVSVPDLTSSLSLTKTTEDGKNLSGWRFGIYSDSGCTALISGPHTTDANGKISVSDLTAQTVYVKELGHIDSTINALYSCSSTNPQKVTLTAGETSTVSFYNKLNTGSVKLVKTTNTGKDLSGWQIGLYYDTACTNPVPGSPFTTGTDGSVTVSDLKPGTLYAKEVSINDPYWVCDASVETVNVAANQTSTVSFSNTHYGDLRIKKDAVNGSAAGWSFQIMDSNRNLIATIKTGADGYAYSDMLLPGQYYVREVHDRDDTYWDYDATVEKQVTITAGSQAEVAYTNTQYGRISFHKTTNTGNHLDGWTFRVTDSNSNVIGEYTTDETGYAITEKLAPGRYRVQELNTDDLYWQTEIVPHDVTVIAGETAVDSWHNVEQGLGWFHKATNTGESLKGWKITIYADEACTEEIYTLTTNEEGKAGYYLDPGTYWAKETGDEYGRFESEYWLVDETIQKFEIKPHEDTEVYFTNTQYGKIRVVKSMDTDGSLAGWKFRITDTSGNEIVGSPYISQADGTILTENVLPGQYTIEELFDEGSPYFCKSENPQTITVTQGKVAEVSFTNTLRPGKITVSKVDTTGTTLAGAVFLLEWSAEGSLWYPVEYAASEDVVRGGCSSPDLVDGCLTTGEDGYLEWGNLYPGLQYRLTEIEAPEGYELLTEYAFEGELPIDTLTVSLKVVNGEGFNLPDTGSATALLLRISQVVCTIVCAALLLTSYKKRW